MKEVLLALGVVLLLLGFLYAPALIFVGGVLLACFLIMKLQEEEDARRKPTKKSERDDKTPV